MQIKETTLNLEETTSLVFKAITSMGTFENQDLDDILTFVMDVIDFDENYNPELNNKTLTLSSLGNYLKNLFNVPVTLSNSITDFDGSTIFIEKDSIDYVLKINWN